MQATTNQRVPCVIKEEYATRRRETTNKEQGFEAEVRQLLRNKGLEKRVMDSEDEVDLLMVDYGTDQRLVHSFTSPRKPECVQVRLECEKKSLKPTLCVFFVVKSVGHVRITTAVGCFGFLPSYEPDWKESKGRDGRLRFVSSVPLSRFSWTLEEPVPLLTKRVRADEDKGKEFKKPRLAQRQRREEDDAFVVPHEEEESTAAVAPEVPDPEGCCPPSPPPQTWEDVDLENFDFWIPENVRRTPRGLGEEEDLAKHRPERKGFYVPDAIEDSQKGFKKAMRREDIVSLCLQRMQRLRLRRLEIDAGQWNEEYEKEWMEETKRLLDEGVSEDNPLCPEALVFSVTAVANEKPDLLEHLLALEIDALSAFGRHEGWGEDAIRSAEKKAASQCRRLAALSREHYPTLPFAVHNATRRIARFWSLSREVDE